MDEDTREIEREIIEEREELGDSLRELQDQARNLTSWRRQYRDHTGGALAIAFTGGVVLGLLTKTNRSRPSFDADDEDLFETEGVPRHLAESARTRGRGFHFRRLKDFQDTHAGRQLSDTLFGMLEVLIGVASTKAIQMVGHLIPGFEDEYRSRHQRSRTTSDVRH